MSKHVWVIDDDHAIRWVLDRALAQAGIPITAFDSADEAMHYLPKETPLAIITDIRMQGTSGLDFLAEFNNFAAHPPEDLTSSGAPAMLNCRSHSLMMPARPLGE